MEYSKYSKKISNDSSFAFFCWFGHCTTHINKKVGTKLLVFTRSYKFSEIDHCSAQINTNVLIFCWFGDDFLVVGRGSALWVWWLLQVSMVGCGYGGLVVFWMAHLHPKLVEKVVFVDVESHIDSKSQRVFLGQFDYDHISEFLLPSTVKGLQNLASVATHKRIHNKLSEFISRNVLDIRYRIHTYHLSLYEAGMLINLVKHIAISARWLANPIVQIQIQFTSWIFELIWISYSLS